MTPPTLKPPTLKTTDPLIDPENGHILTRAIIDTIQEPLIILDEELRVIAASNSFYKKFNVDFNTTHNQLFYELGNGEWNIPVLRKLLEEVIPEHKLIEDYEVKQTFLQIGPRTMLLNAREISYENGRKKMLVSIFDVTEQRSLELQKENLLIQKDILLKEMRHRIANSLQIIASILLLKAQSVTSEETRSQLEEVHDRIMSIATVQGHLDPAGLDGEVDIASYLNALCQSLAKSMIGNRRPISIKVQADQGKATTDEAIGLGLITTELIINALKHAFKTKEAGEIIVTYKKPQEKGWELIIADDGQGMPKDDLVNRKGLGSVSSTLSSNNYMQS